MSAADVPNIDSYNFPDFTLVEDAASTDAILIFTNDIDFQLRGEKTNEYGIVFVSKSKTIGRGPIKFRSGTPVGYGIMRRDDLQLPNKNLPGEKMTGSTSESIRESLERTERFAHTDRELDGSIKRGHLWFGYENKHRANWSLAKCKSENFPDCFQVKVFKNPTSRSGGDAWDASELVTIHIERGAKINEVEASMKSFVEGLSKEAKAHFVSLDLSMFLPVGNDNRRVRVWSIRKGWANVVGQEFGQYKSSNEVTERSYLDFED